MTWISFVLTAAYILAVSCRVLPEDVKCTGSDQWYNQWYKDAEDLLFANKNHHEMYNKAKNVILFVGDGMGPSTVTAGRILAGQIKGNLGEENVLSWEDFPNVAFSKTYNTDYQVSDSAGTATALLTGVKTKSGVISVDEKVYRGYCQTGNPVISLTQLAEKAGLSTGVVTTTRITHATPASAYANSDSRSWENDGDIRDKRCKDIASQLIDFKYGDGLEVAFGGGRRYFYPRNDPDPSGDGDYGRRRDGRRLTEEWVAKSNATHKYKYIWNPAQLRALDASKVDHVLGLFSYSHMDYAHYRLMDGRQPSLVEMLEKAIQILSKNPKGYFLLVEAGRIDHGHHGNKAYQALFDTVELDNTVQKAKELTSESDTLLIVTADHSHVFTMAGEQTRGADILGFTNKHTDEIQDNMNMTVLGYANGPSGLRYYTRRNPTQADVTDPDYRYQSLVPLYSETHAGEDVGVYSRGPQSHLLRGVVEQNYIYHVMDTALCLSEDKGKICAEHNIH